MSGITAAGREKISMKKIYMDRLMLGVGQCLNGGDMIIQHSPDSHVI